MKTSLYLFAGSTAVVYFVGLLFSESLDPMLWNPFTKVVCILFEAFFVYLVVMDFMAHKPENNSKNHKK